MPYMNFILGVLVLIILIVSFILTMRAGKLTDVRQSEYDTNINEKVQTRPYIRNPIFIAYIVGIGVMLFYLIYVGATSSW